MIHKFIKIIKENAGITTFLTFLFIALPTLIISLIKNNEITLYLYVIFTLFSFCFICLFLFFYLQKVSKKSKKSRLQRVTDQKDYKFNQKERFRFKIYIIILLVINIIVSYCFISRYKEPTIYDDGQLMQAVKICYVKVDSLSVYKKTGEICGKKVTFVEDEIIDIAEKYTLPGSFIGFLVLELEKKGGLSVTNLKIPRKRQFHSYYYSNKFATKHQILNKKNWWCHKKNSVFEKDEWEPLKSINPDDRLLIPFCITSKIRVNGEPTDREIPDLFNNAEHIILYYHISKIKYKTNGSNKWQSKSVEPMKTYKLFCQ